jgi:hypothetical protein
MKKKGYIALGALGAVAAASIAGVLVARQVQARRRQKAGQAAESNGK